MKAFNAGGMDQDENHVCAPGDGGMAAASSHAAVPQTMSSLMLLLEMQRDMAVEQLRCEGLQGYLETVLSSAVRLPGFDCGGVYLCDKNSGELELIAHRGLSETFIKQVGHYHGDSPQALLVRAGKPVYGTREDLPPEVAESVAAEGLQLLAIIPIRDEDRVVAALNVSSHAHARIEHASRIMLETLAAQAEGTIALIRTREARQQAERQLWLAAEGAEIGSWVADFNSGGFEASELTLALHGIPSDFVLNAESAMEAVHPDDREKVAAALKRSIEHGEPYSCEYRTWLPGREGRWVYSTARFFDDRGHRRLYGVSWGITNNKKSEAALLEARETLERRVAERTAELEAANDALREQTEHLEMALDASHAGVSSWDIGSETLDWDNRVRMLYGFEKDGPITLEDLWGEMHPEDREKLRADVAAIDSPGCEDSWNHEFRIIHPVLGERWIGRLGRVERDETGRARRALGITFDITDRKRTEESLRRSEEKYRSLYESMMDAYASIDMDGRIIESNRAFQEMLGYTQDELCQLSYQDITPEKWHAMELEIAADERFLARGYTELYEKEYRRKDGCVFPVELRTFLLRNPNGVPTAMWAIVRDITERKTAEQTMLELNYNLERRVAERTAELRHSEARFRQLAEATFEGIAICEDGILMDANPQLAVINGYELSEMIGRPILDFIAPESREFLEERIKDPHETNYEFVGLRKDGSTFPGESHAFMRMWQGRRIRVSAVRDLTKVKQAAARLQAQQKELAQAQRLALISEISAGIVHQLAQPLSAIGMNIAAALADPETCGSPRCRHLEILAALQADVVRMRDTITHLRALADVERPKRSSIGFNELVERVLPLLREEAGRCQTKLMFNPGQNLPTVSADTVQISQVVLNLVRNAFEACANKEPDQRLVRLTTGVMVDGNVELNVIDSGSGIAEEVLARMFTPLFSTKPEGLGIGLRLSRTIVHAHGGDIFGRNNSDSPGATFSVILPVDGETIP